MVDLTLRGQYEETIRWVRHGELAQAVAMCHRILEAFPKHIGTYGILGQIRLQMGEHEEAANLFRRVLSADPEHTLSYASLGAIYEERGLMEEAIWQMERAIELSPGNREIRQELRRLYGGRDLFGPRRIKMTRGALARVYLQGQLYPKVIGELRALVVDASHRFDLRVALAEALWHDARYSDAEVVCDGILAELPNCLKANLILGQIWLNTEKDEEGRALLQRAQTLDPGNDVAQAIFGSRSPLARRMVRLPFKNEDAPPLDLPYLVDDEEVVAETAIIDSLAKALPQDSEDAPLSDGGYQVSLESGKSTADGKMPLEMNEELPTLLEGTIEEATRPGERTRISALDSQHQHIEEHPRDDSARLALARRFRDIGDIDRALECYAYLVQDQRRQVVQDLELMNRLCPGNAALLALLLSAREGSALGDAER